MLSKGSRCGGTRFGVWAESGVVKAALFFVVKVDAIEDDEKRGGKRGRRRRRRRRGRRRAITDAHRRPSQKIRKRGRHDDTHTTHTHRRRSHTKDTEEGGGATKTFDQTVEMSIRLGVNPKRSDMIVRGTCNLPKRNGEKFYVLAFAENEEDRELAKHAGADAVGGEELIERIKNGSFEDLNKVNVCVATPGIVPKLKSSGLARTLGPKGLMPNPKVGSLTAEVGKAVRDAKSGGRVEYRAEKNAIVHAGIGKTSFEDDAIVENASCLMASVLKNRPKGKGAPAMSNYIKKVYLSTTMSKGSRRMNVKELIKLAEEFDQRKKSSGESTEEGS